MEKHGLNPKAVQVMNEAGVDISRQRSKLIDELPSLDYDFVVTVCHKALETCPYFPGPVSIIHVGFDDPPSLAVFADTEEEILAIYRRVRDEIKEFVETIPESFENFSKTHPDSVTTW